METNRSLYGGGVLLGGNAEITLFGFNADGNPVTCHVPGHKIITTLNALDHRFEGITKPSAIYLFTEGQNTHWLVVDDKMKKLNATIPVTKCWDALDGIGKFVPVNVNNVHVAA